MIDAKQIEAVILQKQEERLDRDEAHFNQQKAAVANNPGNWFSGRSFDRKEHRKRDQLEKLVKGFMMALWACKDGRIERGDMKGFTYSVTAGAFTDVDCSQKRTVTESKERHKVYVDVGLSLVFQGHVGIRLSGDPDAIRAKPGCVPQFVQGVLKSYGVVGTEAVYWEGIIALQQEDFEGLCQRYEAVLAEIAPLADKVAEKHWRKLEKSRERATRPEVVAKREAEARARARESLSKLLGTSAKSVLDVWTAEDILKYLRLCQKHGYILRELMTWSGQTPLGSKAIELEDVQTALEMAKVRDVMES
jgi:hypothetical protein